MKVQIKVLFLLTPETHLYFGGNYDCVYLSACIIVQAGKNPGQVNPEQCYDNCCEPQENQNAVDTGVLFAKHVPEM